MWETLHRLHCDYCESYIDTWYQFKPNITAIRQVAKVVYNNGKRTILCNDCFNKLNNKQNERN